jgi:GT2 family glycosyltransferase
LISQTEDIWIRHGRRVNPHNKHHKRAGDIFIDSLELCLISPSAVIMRKELFDKVGLFDETLPACEDYDLWLRVTSRYSVGLLPEQLIVRYAGHADQLSARYWGLDRFRIKTLVKILKADLSAEQIVAVKKVLYAKMNILATGALKRRRLFTWLYYRCMLYAYFPGSK